MRADAYNTKYKSCPPPSLDMSAILGRLVFLKTRQIKHLSSFFFFLKKEKRFIYKPCRTTWPTFDRQTLHSVPSDCAFLKALVTQNKLHLAGLQWRTRLFLQGEVYLETSTRKTFRAVASTSGATLGWPVEPATRSLSGRASSPLPNCFQLGTSQPEWFVLLSYEDFEAVPCQVISPYGAFARGLTENISSGVVLWQCGPEDSVLGHAARKGFKGLKDADLQPLLRELNLQSVGYLICKKRFFLFF
jgi:hypothetical protein